QVSEAFLARRIVDGTNRIADAHPHHVGRPIGQDRETIPGTRLEHISGCTHGEAPVGFRWLEYRAARHQPGDAYTPTKPHAATLSAVVDRVENLLEGNVVRVTAGRFKARFRGRGCRNVCWRLERTRASTATATTLNSVR